MITAKYTEVLKNLMDVEQTRELLNKSLSSYPLYEQKNKDIEMIIPTRNELNKRLLNAYKYREIGFETVGRFLEALEDTMCEIMTIYNERYKTIEIMAELPNPFDNVDVIETFSEKRTDTGESESKGQTEAQDESTANTSSDSNSKNVMTDTPQDEISIPASELDNVEHANTVEWNKTGGSATNNTIGASSSSSTSNGSHSSEGTTEHTFTKKGNQGVNTYAHDMNEFRTSIIDVTNEIINDKRIKELFMSVY